MAILIAFLFLCAVALGAAVAQLVQVITGPGIAPWAT